jgi:hypothetical protein
VIYYFDTSALQHRYVDGSKSRGIRKTISDKRNTCYISELSTVEIFSAFGRYCRKNDLGLSVFKSMEQIFWRDVADGTVSVRAATKVDYQRARHLLQHAGVERKKKIGSSDAVIAANCLGLALDTDETVTFCLEDWPLYNIIRDVSAYSRLLRFRFIGTDKSITPKQNP